MLKFIDIVAVPPRLPVRVHEARATRPEWELPVSVDAGLCV